MPVYNFSCPNCDKLLENLFLTLKEYDNLGQIPELKCDCTNPPTQMLQAYLRAPSVLTMIKTHTATGKQYTEEVKRKIKEDRKKRSTEHFKKEIMPTLSKKNRLYFERKFKK